MGLFSKIFASTKQPETPTTQTKTSQASAQAAPKPYIPSTPKKEVDITIPDWKDGAERKYWYSVKINVTDMKTLSERALAKEFLLDVKEISGEIHVFSGNNDIGILEDKVDMIQDWQNEMTHISFVWSMFIRTNQKSLVLES